MKHTKKVVAGAVIIAAAVPFLKGWEGTDLVAKRDMIGTGHPLTYCHGATSVDGAVKSGQRFTPAQCDTILAKSITKYLTPLQTCVKSAPVKTMAALLDAAYNAGPSAVCHSPMVAKINAGDIKGGCNAFYSEVRHRPNGWYIYASGRVVKGLINRRKAERGLCLQGLTEPTPRKRWWTDPPPDDTPWWQRPWAKLMSSLG